MVKEIDKLDDQIHQLKKELILTAEANGKDKVIYDRGIQLIE